MKPIFSAPSSQSEPDLFLDVDDDDSYPLPASSTLPSSTQTPSFPDVHTLNKTLTECRPPTALSLLSTPPTPDLHTR